MVSEDILSHVVFHDFEWFPIMEKIMKKRQTIVCRDVSLQSMCRTSFQNLNFLKQSTTMGTGVSIQSVGHHFWGFEIFWKSGPKRQALVCRFLLDFENFPKVIEIIRNNRLQFMGSEDMLSYIVLRDFEGFPKTMKIMKNQHAIVCLFYMIFIVFGNRSRSCKTTYDSMSSEPMNCSLSFFIISITFGKFSKSRRKKTTYYSMSFFHDFRRSWKSFKIMQNDIR